jgi:hypothetical protein
VANVELDTNATDLPPVIYGAWVLRGDQVDQLPDAVREGAPDCSERGAARMLVEARIFGRVASAWVTAEGQAVEERFHEHGEELLATFAVDARDVPYVLADMRDLDERGRPSKRNAACRCGSGRKAKDCVHHGPPRFFTTAWLLLDREEWDGFVTQEAEFATIPAMPRDRARIAVRHHTLANKTLATLTTDFAPGRPPFLPWTLLTETVTTLSAAVVDQAPFLREAKVSLTVARPDRAHMARARTDDHGSRAGGIG